MEIRMLLLLDSRAVVIITREEVNTGLCSFTRSVPVLKRLKACNAVSSFEVPPVATRTKRTVSVSVWTFVSPQGGLVYPCGPLCPLRVDLCIRVDLCVTSWWTCASVWTCESGVDLYIRVNQCIPYVPVYPAWTCVSVWTCVPGVDTVCQCVSVWICVSVRACVSDVDLYMRVSVYPVWTCVCVWTCAST